MRGGARSGYCRGPAHESVDELRCGNVTAKIRTTCIEQISSGWECVSQSLQLINRGGISKKVPLDVRRTPSSVIKGIKALDGHVTEWACIQAESQRRYLYLLYSCRIFGDGCGTLSPSGEWDQIIDTTGNVVAGGRTGSEPALLQRLGLSDIQRNGFSTTAVGPDK